MKMLVKKKPQYRETRGNWRYGICWVFCLLSSACSALQKTQVPGNEKVEVDKEAIRLKIRTVLEPIKNCYEYELRSHPELEGKLVVTLLIEAKGVAKAVKIKNSTLKSREVETCVTSILQKVTYPEPPTDAVFEIDYPFVFGKGR